VMLMGESFVWKRSLYHLGMPGFFCLATVVHAQPLPNKLKLFGGYTLHVGL
jgi:hypothetical protein